MLLNDKDLNRILHNAQRTKKIISTWDLLKEKDFHLNSDFLVIQKRDLEDLIIEIIEATQTKESRE